MKTKDEIIIDLLEVIDEIAETIEDATLLESDFNIVQPIVEQLREELVALSEVE
jgi:hypothetical protein